MKFDKSYLVILPAFICGYLSALVTADGSIAGSISAIGSISAGAGTVFLAVIGYKTANAWQSQKIFDGLSLLEAELHKAELLVRDVCSLFTQAKYFSDEIVNNGQTIYLYRNGNEIISQTSQQSLTSKLNQVLNTVQHLKNMMLGLAPLISTSEANSIFDRLNIWSDTIENYLRDMDEKVDSQFHNGYKEKLDQDYNYLVGAVYQLKKGKI